MLLHAAEQRRAARSQADIAEAVAIGYSSMRSDEGPALLQRFMDERRK